MASNQTRWLLGLIGVASVAAVVVWVWQPARESRDRLDPIFVKPGEKLADPSAPVARQLVPMKAIDLNVAAESDLRTLPGITDDYAKRIVANRPYTSMEDLGRTGIPRTVLEHISPPATLVIKNSPSNRP